MWGAGTAIGELPPYFVARASAMSNRDERKQNNRNKSHVVEEKDEDMEEFEHLLEAEKSGKANLSFMDRLRLGVFKIIKKVWNFFENFN